METLLNIIDGRGGSGCDGLLQHTYYIVDVEPQCQTRTNWLKLTESNQISTFKTEQNKRSPPLQGMPTIPQHWTVADVNFLNFNFLI